MINLIIRQKDLENKKPIIEFTGEGLASINGYFSNYYHKRSIRALKLRLTKLRNDKDMFAKIFIYCHKNSDDQNVYQDIETEEYRTI
jgi:hypothetical protein